LPHVCYLRLLRSVAVWLRYGYGLLFVVRYVVVCLFVTLLLLLFTLLLIYVGCCWLLLPLVVRLVVVALLHHTFTVVYVLLRFTFGYVVVSLYVCGCCYVCCWLLAFVTFVVYIVPRYVLLVCCLRCTRLVVIGCLFTGLRLRYVGYVVVVRWLLLTR